MKIKKIVILGFLTLSLFTGCGDKDKTEENTVTQVNKEIIPQFNFITTTGKAITISAHKDGWKFTGLENKVVLLSFFGTWCPPCKAEIPHLNNIKSKLEKNFEILAVDVGPRSGGLNSKEHLADFIVEFDLKYPVISGEVAKKLFAAVSELNPNGSIPFMILFNKQGQYVKYYVGMQAEEMLYNDIRTTIKMK